MLQNQICQFRGIAHENVRVEGERGWEAELGGPPGVRRVRDCKARVATRERIEREVLTFSHDGEFGGTDPLSLTMGSELLGPGRTS